MVDIATEALKSKNFQLASEIYERVITEKGPACHLLIDLGNCLALGGRISEAFTAYLKAYRLGRVIPEQIKELVQALVKLTRERMEHTTEQDQVKNILLDTKELLDTEPFFCGICLGTICEPTTIYCGHTFCRKCVSKRDIHDCVCCGKNPRLSGTYKPNVILSDVVHKLFPNLEEITKLKSEANQRFAERQYKDAINRYTEILDISKNDHTIWSNRSYAHFMLEDFEQALSDAVQTIKLRPQWAKGYYRRGSSEEALGRIQEAAISYMKCLAIDNQAQQADKSLTQIIHNLLKPKMTSENLKHVPSARKEPVSKLMEAGDSDTNIADGLAQVKALLDKQFQECDPVLQFESEVEKVDPSLLTADMLECSLCYRLLHNPVTTPCGHVFCQHCLDRSMDHSLSCPQCRGSLTEMLALRNRSTTVSLQCILKLWFPKLMEERKKLHEQDLAAFSLAGNTAEIPVFVCTVAYPTISCPLHVFEPRYRLMMRQVMESGVRQFGMCIGEEDGKFADYGTMLEICDLKFFDDGRSVVDTVGGRRFRVLDRGMRDGYNTAKIEFLEDSTFEGSDLSELKQVYDAMYSKVSNWINSLPARIAMKIQQQFGNLPQKDIDFQAVRLGPKWVWWVLAILPLEMADQVSILQMNSLKDRLVAIDRALSMISCRQ